MLNYGDRDYRPLLAWPGWRRLLAPVHALRARYRARLLDAEWRRWQARSDDPLDRP